MLRAAYACCRQPTACRLLSPSHAWAALAGHQLSAALLGAAATAAVSPARQLQTTALASTRSSRLPALLQEPAPSPKSALESAAVILKAHAEVLQRAGLSKAAAYAVAKAWNAEGIKGLDATREAPLHHARTDKPLVSPRRLLVCIRRIMQAHAAAAESAGVQAHAAAAANSGVQAHAAAANSGAGKQAGAQKRRKGAGAGAAAAAAAQKGGADAATGGERRRRAAAAATAAVVEAAAGSGKLDWGLLDLHRIVSRDPTLLTLPPSELSSRLNALLSSAAAVLGPSLAVRFIETHAKPRLLLADTQAALSNLQERARVYAEVVGVPPCPALLVESGSSRYSLQLFQRKLQHLVDKFGQATTHATLSHGPHLLASRISTLDANTQQMQQLLGCSDSEMARVVSRAPRVISTKPELVAQHLKELTNMLMQKAGFSGKDVQGVVMKLPQLLVAQPSAPEGKLAKLEELLGPSQHRLRFCVKQHPHVLLYSSKFLSDQFHGMQSLLGLDRDAASSMLAAAPTLFGHDLETLTKRLQQLAQVLGIALAETPAVVARSANLLALRPALVDSKITLWSQALGVDRTDVARFIVSYPAVALFDAQTVVAHMEMLQSLVARSSRWSAMLGPAGGTAAKSAVATAAAPPPAAPAAAPAAAAAAGGGKPHVGVADGSSEPPAQQHQQLAKKRGQRGRGCFWPLLYSRNIGGCLLLRLEYLLATGQDCEVTVGSAARMAVAQWAETFPDFPGWVQLRLQHLQQDPSDWPPVLVSKALKWGAAKRPTGAVAGGRAAAGRRAGHASSSSSGTERKSRPPASLKKPPPPATDAPAAAAKAGPVTRAKKGTKRGGSSSSDKKAQQ